MFKDFLFTDTLKVVMPLGINHATEEETWNPAALETYVIFIYPYRLTAWDGEVVVHHPDESQSHHFEV